jgi:hypothetical protein
MPEQDKYITGYIHASELDPGEYRYSIFGCDMSDCGYIPIAEVQVPCPDITPDQIKARHIVLLRLERDQIYARAKQEADRLNERIARLESIGYDEPSQLPE